jgi:hypothetical protein
MSAAGDVLAERTVHYCGSGATAAEYPGDDARRRAKDAVAGS